MDQDSNPVYRTAAEYQRAELSSYLDELHSYNAMGIEHVLMGIAIFDDEYKKIIHTLLGKSYAITSGDVNEPLVTGAIHIVNHCFVTLSGLSGLTASGNDISTVLG